MNKNSKFMSIALLSLLIVCSFGSLVSAQSGYNNEVTTPVTIGSDGTFSGMRFRHRRGIFNSRSSWSNRQCNCSSLQC